MSHNLQVTLLKRNLSFLSGEVHYFVLKYSKNKEEVVIKSKIFIKNINSPVFFLEENSVDIRDLRLS